MKEEIKKELNELGSSLKEKIEQEKTALPENYFARMQQSVLSEVRDSNTAIEKQASPWKALQDFLRGLIAPRPAIALAGLAAIIIFFVFFKPEAEIESPSFANLDNSAIELYVDNYIDEFDKDLFVELFSEEEDFTLESGTTTEELYIDEALDDLDILDIEELL